MLLMKLGLSATDLLRRKEPQGELLRDDVLRARATHGDDHAEVAQLVGVPKADLLRCLARWGLLEDARSEPAPAVAPAPAVTAPAAQARAARPSPAVSEPERRAERSGSVVIPGRAKTAEAPRKASRRASK